MTSTNYTIRSVVKKVEAQTALHPDTLDLYREIYEITIRRFDVVQAGPSKNKIRPRENNFKENSLTVGQSII